jgi:hypothetical protein
LYAVREDYGFYTAGKFQVVGSRKSMSESARLEGYNGLAYFQRRGDLLVYMKPCRELSHQNPKSFLP